MFHDDYDVQRDYAFGQSDRETQRLIVQSRLLEPFTERLLVAAGIAPGMRILDLGCGPGDVALLAARMVGESGAVVGVDQHSDVLATARERARAAGAANVTFREGSAESLGEAASFDVVTSRCVAFFSSDPVAYLRAAARAVRPGGVLAIQEPDTRYTPVTDPGARIGRFSAPRIEEFERIGEAFDRALAASVPSHDVAPRLTEHFLDAGLPAPRLAVDVLVGSGPDSALYALVAHCFASMVPQMRRHGIDGYDDLAAEPVDALAERLRELAVRHRSQITFYTLVGAWALRAGEQFRGL